MLNQLAPSDGYAYRHKEDRDANAAKLNSCQHHIFLPAEDSASTDSTQDCVCGMCGGIVPIRLAEWYNYGFDHALGTVESLIDRTLYPPQAGNQSP
jgi:hypothetical protein